jgi:hypothetical protein
MGVGASPTPKGVPSSCHMLLDPPHLGDGSTPVDAAGVWEGVSIGAFWPLSAAMAFALMASVVPLKRLLLLLCLLGISELRLDCPLRSGLLHPLHLLWRRLQLLLLQLRFRGLFGCGCICCPP